MFFILAIARVLRSLILVILACCGVFPMVWILSVKLFQIVSRLGFGNEDVEPHACGTIRIINKLVTINGRFMLIFLSYVYK